MSSDTKRYGSSFGRPSSSGASSFGFEPAANPLRAPGLADPNQGPKVYSGESFDEPAQPAGYDASEYSETEFDDAGYEAPAFDGNNFDQPDANQSGFDQGGPADYQPADFNPDDGFADYQEADADSGYAEDTAPAASLRDRLASRFGESLSFRRSRGDQAAPAASDQDYDAQDYGEPSFADAEYQDQGYGDQTSNAGGYEAGSYDDGGYGDQTHANQGYDDAGYQDQGFGGQAYGDYQEPAPAKERASSGWRSRFANRTAGLAGQDAASTDYGYGATDYNQDGGYGDQSYGGSSYDSGYGDFDQSGGGNFGGYGQSDYGKSDYGQADYNQADYGQSDFSQSDFGQNDFSQSDYNQSDYNQGEFSQGVDPYGTGGANRNTIAAPGLKPGFMSGLKLDLGSKWLMPAASIAGGVLVLAVLLYLFNPFAGNPLESPESISAVETMLAGLDIDPGAQDGIADEDYRLAIVEFQEMHGLSQTGELTPEVFQEMTAIYELSNL